MALQWGVVEALSYTAREGWVSCRKTFFGSFFEERIALQGHPCMSFFKKDNMGFGGIPHSMKWKKEIGGKGWRFVKKLAKNLVVS